jgi:hypothetical protein
MALGRWFDVLRFQDVFDKVGSLVLHFGLDDFQSDSQGLHEAHTILTKGKQEFRPDLRITEITSHVMFVYGAVFHPAIHPYRQGILDAALNLFGEDSLAVMWKATSGLSEKELADLGFCKIAGSDLIFRHSALRMPFYDTHPTGQDAPGAVAKAEDEEWVLQEWKKYRGVLP